MMMTTMTKAQKMMMMTATDWDSRHRQVRRCRSVWGNACLDDDDDSCDYDDNDDEGEDDDDDSNGLGLQAQAGEEVSERVR